MFDHRSSQDYRYWGIWLWVKVPGKPSLWDVWHLLSFKSMSAEQSLLIWTKSQKRSPFPLHLLWNLSIHCLNAMTGLSSLLRVSQARVQLDQTSSCSTSSWRRMNWSSQGLTPPLLLFPPLRLPGKSMQQSSSSRALLFSLPLWFEKTRALVVYKQRGQTWVSWLLEKGAASSLLLSA